MKIDAEKLEKKINDMSSVCEKGRKEIKSLFAEAFGVEFKDKKETQVRPGDIVTFDDDHKYLVGYAGIDKYAFISMSGHCWKNGSTDKIGEKSTINIEDLTYYPERVKHIERGPRWD